MSLILVQSSRALVSHLLFADPVPGRPRRIWSAPTLRELSLGEGSPGIRLADGDWKGRQGLEW